MQTEIINTLKILESGGTILYPTDTVWGIGCDATNNKAVAKIFKIKNRKEQKSLIILLDSIDEISKYVRHFPLQVKDLIHHYHKPLTVVFPDAKNLAKNLIAKDGTIAIRVVKHPFCKKLIKEFGKPLVSTSANLSGNPTPNLFRDISTILKKKVNYVVNLEQDSLNPASPSTIIKVDTTGNYEILRA